MKINALNNL